MDINIDIYSDRRCREKEFYTRAQAVSWKIVPDGFVSSPPRPTGLVVVVINSPTLCVAFILVVSRNDAGTHAPALQVCVCV